MLQQLEIWLQDVLEDLGIIFLQKMSLLFELLTITVELLTITVELLTITVELLTITVLTHLNFKFMFNICFCV